ncbi:MAG: cysteine--tRNA ligase [bacterium]|nr:cysteine--tRNA ligase [bacterium]
MKEGFAPLESGAVRVYTCGPTVYSRQHIGNLRTYVFSDLLVRGLRMFGFEVKQVINITDVGHLTDDSDDGEDKMEQAAAASGETAWDVAERWTTIFREDLAKMNIGEPAIWCKATDHIAEQIEMIEKLEGKGFIYTTDDGVYFDTAKDPHYGELARLDIESQQSQDRIEGASQKRNRGDFALWKKSPEDGPRRQMEWDSPWGRGFPGWHIECSAMSTKYLGEQFDIHTGGVDHVPVHHPNEIAQSENALGVRPWVRFWLHGGWLMFDGEKMSKSKGGILALDELEERGIEPLAYRYFLLNGHYRQQLSFNDEGIEGAKTAYRRLHRRAAEIRQADDSAGGDRVAGFRERFVEAISDDLNAPRALAVTWEVVRSDVLGSREKAGLLAEFDQVLGLDLAQAEVAAGESDERIDALVRGRDEARAARDWARADEIRDQLQAEGIVLEDSPDGTRWHRA